MELTQYLKALPPGEAAAFAERCGVTFRHLQNITYGERQASPALAVAMERESGGVVTRKESRPDDWWAHWLDIPGADRERAHAKRAKGVA